MLDLHPEEVQGGDAVPAPAGRVQVRGGPRAALRAQVRQGEPLQLLWRRYGLTGQMRRGDFKYKIFLDVDEMRSISIIRSVHLCKLKF